MGETWTYSAVLIIYLILLVVIGWASSKRLKKARRLHYLYDRAAADLAKLTTFASEPAVRSYLESLVSRAYCHIHETRRFPGRFAPIRWFFRTFPQTFRRRIHAFYLSLAVTLAGAAFGAFAVLIDPEAKDAIVPDRLQFRHLLEDPAKRVAREEATRGKHLAGRKAQFSALLMTHNTRYSITAVALGMTWGVGTIIALFYNGAVLGMVAADYVRAGQAEFLLGWLLPHGAVEIPALLLAGQGGLVLGGALIGWGSRKTIRTRMREVAPDVVTLIGGLAILLVWAGVVEAFLSQYHEPVLPYGVKIAFGLVELGLLTLFLAKSGSRPGRQRRD